MSAACRSVLLACLAIVASACPAAAADIDRYLPDDAELVVHVNLRQLLDAPLVKKHFLETAKNALDSDAFKPRTALLALRIDPLQDITSITLAAAPRPAADNGLLIIRGKFDLPVIHDAADAYASSNGDALKIHKQEELRIYELKEQRSGRSVFLCFLSKDTAVASPTKPAIEQASARHQGKKQAKPAKELQALLEKTDGKQSVWLAAFVSDDLKKAVAGDPQVQKAIAGIQAFQGGITVDAGLRADFTLHTINARTATEVRKLLDGIKSIVGLAVMDNERLGSFPADLVGALKLATDKEALTLKG